MTSSRHHTPKWLLFYALLCASMSASASGEPWRLATALHLPNWVSLSGQQRIRFENLDNQFRLGQAGGDQMLALRTNVLLQLDFQKVQFAAEMMDSHALLADRGTPISTSDVDPLELLQAWAEVPLNNLFEDGSKSSLKVGRMTMDVGSRRFVARNRFRNTINAFTGVDWQWTDSDNRQMRLFYTLPVQRLAGPDLLHPRVEFDQETTAIRFWGAYFATAALPRGDRGEVYLFGLDENDTPRFATRNRHLYTPGFRLYRPETAGRLGYEIEFAYQFGTFRATTSPSDTTNLHQRAFFAHAELGYSIDAAWKPRLVAQYDYASGNDDPNYNENNRFDTLYGARRFDFGPTGIYGAFARANINSPGMRLIFIPNHDLKGFFAVRGFWLASARDSWTTAGVRDKTGKSGDYIGTQLEAQLQWAVVPGIVDVETGVAHIFPGDIMHSPPGNGNGAPTYFYVQTTLSF